MGERSDSATGDELDVVAAALRSAMADSDPAALGAWLDPLVTWGDCAGAEAVLEFITAATSAGYDAEGLTIAVVGDRLVAEFAAGDGDTMSQAVFVRDGKIAEIIDAIDVDHAASVRPVGRLAAAAGRGWGVDRLSPVLPVAELDAAVDRYRSLGFDVRVYDGDAAYAYASRGTVEFHLAQVADIESSSNNSAVYLFVDDADAVFASWRLAGIAGRLTPPFDTDYGLREGAYVDPDGNLLRFGSPSSAVDASWS